MKICEKNIFFLKLRKKYVFFQNYEKSMFFFKITKKYVFKKCVKFMKNLCFLYKICKI
jgi:hypothetical protein